MKAAVFHGPGRPLTIEDVADPSPGPGEMTIRVCRCGLCSSDVQMTSGQGPTYPAGAALGHEYAGEVVATGRGVTRFRAGDRVAAMPVSGCGHCAACREGRPIGCAQMQMRMGGFGEYTVVAEASAVALPQSLGFDDGALVEPLACSLRAMSKSGLVRGDRVLVQGLGPMGLGAIWWARRLGAGDVVATARSPSRRSLAMAFGATDCVAAPVEEVAALHEALHGAPDIVVECTGAPGMIGHAIARVRPGGTIVCLGVCAHRDTFVPMAASWKEVRIVFSLAYALDDFRHAARTLDRDAVRPAQMVSETIPLAGVPAALEAMRSGSSAVKTLVDPWLAPG